MIKSKVLKSWGTFFDPEPYENDVNKKLLVSDGPIWIKLFLNTIQNEIEYQKILTRMSTPFKLLNNLEGVANVFEIFPQMMKEQVLSWIIPGFDRS